MSSDKSDKAEGETVVLTSVRLSDVRVGSVVEIVTVSGARYWITPILTGRALGDGSDDDTFLGLSIMFQSNHRHGFAAPSLTGGRNKILVGEPWNMNFNGRTSRVMSIEVH